MYNHLGDIKHQLSLQKLKEMTRSRQKTGGLALYSQTALEANKWWIDKVFVKWHQNELLVSFAISN